MEIHAIPKAVAPRDCDVVGKALGRPSINQDYTGEVFIQSETGVDNSREINQAYTCVLISEDNPDYISELRHDYRTKLIPLRTTDINKVTHIKVQWFSDTDMSSGITPRYINATVTPFLADEFYGASGFSFNKSGLNDGDTGFYLTPSRDRPLAPPPISVQLIQAAETFTLESFDINRTATSTNRGTLYLFPFSKDTTHAITADNVIPKTAVARSSDKASNDPIPVKCEQGGAFHCSIIFEVPEPNDSSVRNQGASFLHISLLYGIPNTSLSVMMCENANCSTVANFVGVQARIDSTGRANDLFRRIESRVELVDTRFPIPEFALQVSGDGDSDIIKNFWVTLNNWKGLDSQPFSF
jgi:hypothetical protein